VPIAVRNDEFAIVESLQRGYRKRCANREIKKFHHLSFFKHISPLPLVLEAFYLHLYDDSFSKPNNLLLNKENI